jgi:putative transposase
MSNHVHFIAVPLDNTSFHLAFKSIHRKYAVIKNKELGWCGHLWQERFFSSPIDDAEDDYLWNAVRYTELNPQRAGIVSQAWDYRWSSARAHCGLDSNQLLSTDPKWLLTLSTIKDWKTFLDLPDFKNSLVGIQQFFSRGFPYGSDGFIDKMERVTNRKLRPSKGGRPKKETGEKTR